MDHAARHARFRRSTTCLNPAEGLSGLASYPSEDRKPLQIVSNQTEGVGDARGTAADAAGREAHREAGRRKVRPREAPQVRKSREVRTQREVRKKREVRAQGAGEVRRRKGIGGAESRRSGRGASGRSGAKRR